MEVANLLKTSDFSLTCQLESKVVVFIKKKLEALQTLEKG
jgi:hypothetical protein